MVNQICRCGKAFITDQWRINAGKGKYCSRQCGYAFGNQGRKSLPDKPKLANPYFRFTPINPRAKTIANYSIDVDQWSTIMHNQGHQCALCARTFIGVDTKGIHTDHDHRCCAGYKSCGKCIRGILCHGCNIVIGYIERNECMRPLVTSTVLDYLDRRASF